MVTPVRSRCLSEVELPQRSDPGEAFVDVLGDAVSFWTRGTGEPVLVLHDDIGRGEWNAFLERLSQQFTVTVPALPGFPPTAVPAWMRSISQMAAVMQQVVDGIGLTRCPVVGLGFGAWVAAEMQVQNPTRFSRLVLSSPMGIKPVEGEIVDRFLFAEERWVSMGFADQAAYVQMFGDPDDDLLLRWEAAREMTTRIAWKPYMFDRGLPHLLAGVTVPALVVWGEGDVILPRSCAEQYARILPGATMRTIPGCGHRIELEAPDDLAALVVGFVTGDDLGSRGTGKVD